jgi:hypothetical protein
LRNISKLHNNKKKTPEMNLSRIVLAGNECEFLTFSPASMFQFKSSGTFGGWSGYLEAQTKTP